MRPSAGNQSIPIKAAVGFQRSTHPCRRRLIDQVLELQSPELISRHTHRIRTFFPRAVARLGPTELRLRRLLSHAKPTAPEMSCSITPGSGVGVGVGVSVGVVVGVLVGIAAIVA